jgi:MoaA/NifB/PqqE/SkfB family radical SAM enzyme
MALDISRRIPYRIKREFAERALGQALVLLGNNPNRAARYLITAIDHIARGKEQNIIVGERICSWLAEGKPGRDFLSRMLKNTHPNVRRRLIARVLVNKFFHDPEIGERCMREYGITPPSIMLISPSMRCNYRCEGCYAGSYERKDDMRPDVFDRLLGEAEDIGINLFTILGGEPFIYPELLDILRRHNKSFFQIYTNGSFIDKAMAKRLVEIGNIAPQISVNGPAEYTDASRGKEAFKQVMQAMDNLRHAGCLFGFSTLVTRHNVDAICSEEWIDLLIAKGALYGWLFLYMPVGDDPDMDLMPTPQQRNQLRIAIRHYRQTKPIVPADFWSDGTLTGGCIAGGRFYFHINHRGDIEPCIFCHFATHNINNCSLAEALASPFFREIKEGLPFSYNTLCPCPMIDCPQTMWRIIQRHGAQPTHDGAEKMFTAFAAEMQEYSAGVRKIMDAVWENEDYHNWAPQWALMCNVPPAILEKRRQEYEAWKSG